MKIPATVTNEGLGLSCQRGLWFAPVQVNMETTCSQGNVSFCKVALNCGSVSVLIVAFSGWLPFFSGNLIFRARLSRRKPSLWKMMGCLFLIAVTVSATVAAALAARMAPTLLRRKLIFQCWLSLFHIDYDQRPRTTRFGSVRHGGRARVSRLGGSDESVCFCLI